MPFIFTPDELPPEDVRLWALHRAGRLPRF